jgi:hypothetical protein
MADLNDGDLQLAIMYLVNYPVVTHADAPRVTTLKFFHALWPGIVLQCSERSDDTGMHIFRQSVQPFLN